MWYRTRSFKSHGGIDTSEMAESLIANMVKFGEERKISGETCRRMAMVLNPARLRAEDTFSWSS